MKTRNNIYFLCTQIVLGVEEVVRNLLQLSEEEIGGLRGPGYDSKVTHRVEEERQDDGEAQARKCLKFKST